MKRKIYLLRHGKSDWEADYGDDHERPLAPRGRRAARLMGRVLARAGEVPGLVLTSTARRARATVEEASAAGGWEAPVVATRLLYEGSPAAFLDLLRAQEDARASVLLAGHEPTLPGLGALLVGGRFKMPTATLVRIDVAAAGWRGVEPGSGVLVWLLPPKLLARLGGAEEGS